MDLKKCDLVVDFKKKNIEIYEKCLAVYFGPIIKSKKYFLINFKQKQNNIYRNYKMC